MSKAKEAIRKQLPTIKAKIEEYELSSFLNLPTDEKALNIKLGTTILSTKAKAEDGKEVYDLEMAIDKLVDQCENKARAKACLENARKTGGSKVKGEETEGGVSTSKPTKKRKKKTEDEKDEEEDTGKKSKKSKASKSKSKVEDSSPTSPSESPKKREEIKAKDVQCESNQGMCDAIRQLAGAFFKQGDRFKGGAFQKAATAMAAHPDPITSGKDAEKLKGVGKSTAKKIQEFLDTGKIELLEELRSGANENL